MNGQKKGKEEWMLINIFLMLSVALVMEAAGLVLIRKGMMEVGPITTFNIKALFAVFLRMIATKTLILGVFLNALYFGLLLTLLSWAELSFILPLTALGYLVSASFAKYFLMEHVTPLRWAGTLLIVAGVFLITKSAQP
jgi:drug/metabolite transporter (DMT)-like permease